MLIILLLVLLVIVFILNPYIFGYYQYINGNAISLRDGAEVYLGWLYHDFLGIPENIRSFFILNSFEILILEDIFKNLMDTPTISTYMHSKFKGVYIIHISALKYKQSYESKRQKTIEFYAFRLLEMFYTKNKNISTPISNKNCLLAQCSSTDIEFWIPLTTRGEYFVRREASILGKNMSR